MNLAVVDAAGVYVEGEAEQRLRHHRAFEVPAGRAAAPGRIPFHLSRLAWRGLAPDREVSGVALALDGIDAAFAFLAAVASAAAIIGHRRRVEIEAAVEFVAMLVGARFREFAHRSEERRVGKECV